MLGRKKVCRALWQRFTPIQRDAPTAACAFTWDGHTEGLRRGGCSSPGWRVPHGSPWHSGPAWPRQAQLQPGAHLAAP